MAWTGKVHCETCGNQWQALELPMPLQDAAAALGALECPACGGSEGISALDDDALKEGPRAPLPGRGANPGQAPATGELEDGSMDVQRKLSIRDKNYYGVTLLDCEAPKFEQDIHGAGLRYYARLERKPDGLKLTCAVHRGMPSQGGEQMLGGVYDCSAPFEALHRLESEFMPCPSFKASLEVMLLVSCLEPLEPAPSARAAKARGGTRPEQSAR